MSLLQQVLHVTLPVFGVAAVGYLYGRMSRIPMEAVNRINMGLFVPVLLFHVLTERLPDLAAIGPLAAGAALVVLGSGLLAWIAARLLRQPPTALVPSMMFVNSGNLGLPLAALAFGDRLLPLAVVVFVVSTAMHFSLGIWYLSRRLHPVEMLRNPVFLATVAGLVVNRLGWHTPAVLLPGQAMLAQVAVPLMLVALGVRLTQVETGHWRLGLAAAVLRPLFGVAVAWLAIRLLGLGHDDGRVLLLFGALPPAVMNFIMAERYRQHPHAVASIVALGNLAALLTIPLALAWLL